MSRLCRLFSYGRTGRRIAFITFATVDAAQRAKVTLSAHPEWRSISFAKVGQCVSVSTCYNNAMIVSRSTLHVSFVGDAVVYVRMLAHTGGHVVSRIVCAVCMCVRQRDTIAIPPSPGPAAASSPSPHTTDRTYRSRSPLPVLGEAQCSLR